jgi:thiol-disulfide isomerase/thioredoxin
VTTIPATSGLINLQTPGKGLYTIRVEAEGYESLEFPILLETQGAHGLEFRPRKRGISGTAPVCSDARLVAWEAIHQAQKARHGRKGKAGSLDWKPDLTTLRKAIDSEQDPLTRSFLAACYMDLGSLGADLDPNVMPLMKALLPSESPFWSINPGSVEDVVNHAPKEEQASFLATMSDRHGDPSCRARALYFRTIEAASEYDVETWRAVFGRLTREYPDSGPSRTAQKYYDPGKAFGIGQAFPAFSLTDLEGRPLTLETFKGRILLVDFWATWCPPCVKELPNLQELYKKYKEQGLAVLSLSLDAKPDAVKTFWTKHAMPWDHVLVEGGRDHALPTSLSVSSIPRAFLVGRDGRILENRRGALSAEKLDEAVGKALKEQPPIH